MSDLAVFLLPRSKTSLNEIIENTCNRHNAKECACEKTIRTETAMKRQSENCVDRREIEWYEC